MSKFRNESTGIVVSVADDKDARFGEGWVPAETPEKRTAGRPKKSEPSEKSAE